MLAAHGRRIIMHAVNASAPAPLIRGGTSEKLADRLRSPLTLAD